MGGGWAIWDYCRLGLSGMLGMLLPQEVGPTLQSCEAPLVSYPPPCACSGGYLSNHWGYKASKPSRHPSLDRDLNMEEVYRDHGDRGDFAHHLGSFFMGGLSSSHCRAEWQYVSGGGSDDSCSLKLGEYRAGSAEVLTCTYSHVHAHVQGLLLPKKGTTNCTVWCQSLQEFPSMCHGVARGHLINSSAPLTKWNLPAADVAGHSTILAMHGY